MKVRDLVRLISGSTIRPWLPTMSLLGHLNWLCSSLTSKLGWSISCQASQQVVDAAGVMEHVYSSRGGWGTGVSISCAYY
ncbi:hypothetical protein NEOLI_005348 [Neolecta irregularis DAH-3]|uniref:Uncharacterized protein n=1 Tax=Neolecta irregularis (strain DAH-3) TaxID=1198029 RepID=A0A1U7LM03_NEOID|nr:hypothetical protein NEOLI_005348 [Neolecta irregularis DAH-3]|eukprot:OLL23613.1 hypothetical protein NEOLI_005348 [Neolecta irregularis DAH-3]